MGKYLTDKERYQLEYMYNIQHLSQREIARQLHKHYNTIYNEIKRGTTILLNSDLTERQQYCADVAINKYKYNCTAKGAPLKINNDYEYKSFIESQIKNNHYSFYSANELAKNENFNTRVCLSTLYNYFHSDVFDIRQSDMPVKRIRRKQYIYQAKKIYQFGKRSIEERADISNRDNYGDFEMDTVQGKQGTKTCLLVLTERKTREEIIYKLDNKKCSSVWSVLENVWDDFKNKIKTITCDNGVEFSTNYEFKNRELEKFVRTNLYYCHPYASCERGSNENANKLIRRFIPKSQDISVYTDEYIKHIQDLINNMPRKLFGGLSSYQYMKSIECEVLQQ